MCDHHCYLTTRVFVYTSLPLSRSVNEKIDTYKYVFFFPEIVAHLYVVKCYHSPVEVCLEMGGGMGFSGDIVTPKEAETYPKTLPAGWIFFD